MRKPLMVLLATSLLLAACSRWSDSRVNPGNWFGKNRSAPVDAQTDPQNVNPLIPKRSWAYRGTEVIDASVLIASVTDLRVERTTTGAIVLASGVAARQGGYATSLRLEPPEEGGRTDVLTFTFRVNYPDYPTPVGPERTRTINEARSLTVRDLNGIRLIRVRAAGNLRETRRR